MTPEDTKKTGKGLPFVAWFAPVLIAAFAIGYGVWIYDLQVGGQDYFISFLKKNSAANPGKYADLEKGFSFVYPSTAVLEDPTITFFDSRVAAQLAQAGLDAPKLFSKTNLSEALFTVNSAKLSADKCLSEFTSPPAGKSAQSNVSGVQFKMVNITGAAAGNLYESRVFRATHSSLCYELIETVHTGNIANYPVGTVAEADKAKVWGDLDEILNSFKFTK